MTEHEAMEITEELHPLRTNLSIIGKTITVDPPANLPSLPSCPVVENPGRSKSQIEVRKNGKRILLYINQGGGDSNWKRAWMLVAPFRVPNLQYGTFWGTTNVKGPLENSLVSLGVLSGSKITKSIKLIVKDEMQL